jgi:hypothetical protein
VRRFPLAALTTSALLAIGCGIDDPYQDDAQRTATTTTAATVVDRRGARAPTSAPTRTSSADAHEAQPNALSPAQATAHRSAERVARRCLAGYLPYSYGRRRAATIDGATTELRHELARNPPRVRPGLTRAARPRVRRVRVTGVSTDRAFVFAQITDRRSRYATSLTVVQRRGRWLVSEVR